VRQRGKAALHRLIYLDDRNAPVSISARITLQPVGAETPAGVPVIIWVP
jgi:hypothetical protein